MAGRHDGERPAGKGPRWAMAAVLAACAGAGFLVDLHPHFAIERLPVFHAVLGFVACGVLVAAAGIAGALLGREEGHHER